MVYLNVKEIIIKNNKYLKLIILISKRDSNLSVIDKWLVLESVPFKALISSTHGVIKVLFLGS